jgi:hypothetical protein
VRFFRVFLFVCLFVCLFCLNLAILGLLNSPTVQPNFFLSTSVPHPQLISLIPGPELSIYPGHLKGKEFTLAWCYSERRKLFPFCDKEPGGYEEWKQDRARGQQSFACPRPVAQSVSPGSCEEGQQSRESLGTVPMAGCGGGLEEAIRQGPAQPAPSPLLACEKKARNPIRQSSRLKCWPQAACLAVWSHTLPRRSGARGSPRKVWTPPSINH